MRNTIAVAVDRTTKLNYLFDTYIMPQIRFKMKKTASFSILIHFRHWLLIYAAYLIVGCTALPTIHQQAIKLGFQQEILPGKPFKHIAFINGSPCAGGQWHIYIDGDGKAWITPHRVARDPTPRKSFLLALMGSDPTPSIYLGRPCYHGLRQSLLCNPLVWTQQRYSKTVVESMVQAIKQRLPDRSCQIVLIGYSGGGTLAMLMAAKLAQVKGVVTLAGNLDVGAWTRLHGYSSLQESLDPAFEPPLPETIFQIHVTGAKDTQIPSDVIQNAIQRYPHAKFIKVKDLNHQENWLTIWPEVLETIHSYSKNER